MNSSDSNRFSSKMSGLCLNLDTENNIDVRHGMAMVFGTIFGFGLLNVAATIVGKPRRVNSDAWRWNNLLISWVHGLIGGVWNILCFYFYPELLDDMIQHANYFTYLMVAFSTGYFMYDFLDLLFRRQIFSCWEISIHHIAIASMFYYNLHCKMCIAYNIVVLMAEINSFFLHSRKLLQMLNINYESWFYQTICMVNLLTFITCRGLPFLRVSYGIYIDGYLVPPVYCFALLVSTVLMAVINAVLFWRLFRSDILRNKKKCTKKPEKTTHLNGNNNQPDHIKSS